MRVLLVVPYEDLARLGNIENTLPMQVYQTGWDLHMEKDAMTRSTRFLFIKDEPPMSSPIEPDSVSMGIVTNTIGGDLLSPGVYSNIHITWYFQMANMSIRGDTIMECLRAYERHAKEGKWRSEYKEQVSDEPDHTTKSKRKRLIIMGD